MTKPTKWHVCPAKTQISLGIRPVWSESSLSAWRKLGSFATHWAQSEDSDQTGWMPRLIWVFAGHKASLLVLSWGGSYLELNNWNRLSCFCFTFYIHKFNGDNLAIWKSQLKRYVWVSVTCIQMNATRELVLTRRDKEDVSCFWSKTQTSWVSEMKYHYHHH